MTKPFYKQALALCLSLFSCGAPSPAGPSNVPEDKRDRGEKIGMEIVLKDVDNRTCALSDYLGENVVAISFFATWCEPCKRELVRLDSIFRAHRGRGLMVLAISMDEPETVGDVRPFVRSRGLSFPVLLDEEGAAAGMLNPRRDAPYNLIIDRSLSIVWSKAGYAEGDEKRLEAAIEKALAGAGGPP